MQRVATWLDPDFPLPRSAYLVPVLAGLLGVLPAFAIGRRLGGVLGGFFAARRQRRAIPMLLLRSIGSDNDVWNVVLPLYMAWALVAAMQAAPLAAAASAARCSPAPSPACTPATWSGWSFAFTVLLAGLLAAVALHAVHWGMRHGAWRRGRRRGRARSERWRCSSSRRRRRPPGSPAPARPRSARCGP